MSKHSATAGTRLTVQTLRAMAARGQRIVMSTAYDATFARMLDEAGADVLLVGDSLGMVVQGLDTTLPVTLDEMIYHARAVSRGARRAHLVGDMPFMSYQVSPEQALTNAARFLAEGNMHAVKLEGGADLAETVRRLTRSGIPVMGHVGLMPQSVHAMGGFKVQGKEEDDAERILQDARAIAEAGAYSLVLEGVPAPLAARIRTQVPVPIIGIGAGPDCDGQVLVCYDLLGLTPERVPKFVKMYDTWYARGVSAFQNYASEVRAGLFPSAAHSFGVAAPVVPAASSGSAEIASPALEAKAGEPTH
ncbi:MAG TPA: 3-methyl-2-oxobutanoate hydroxymethyltransferase [Polyangiales bacterium]|nr:3-methyl-2-oxobutanoate hydroxymethyltransferase [Polyangiales bacterium]